MTRDDVDERLFIVGQIPPTVQGRPGEGLERSPVLNVGFEPEQDYATPAWRSEPTTDFDPRKGR